MSGTLLDRKNLEAYETAIMLQVGRTGTTDNKTIKTFCSTSYLRKKCNTKKTGIK